MNIFGAYGLFNPDADFDKCTDDLVADGWDGVSLIIGGRWTQPPDPAEAYFWWPYDSTKGVFNMATQNDAVFNAFKKLLRMCAKKGLAVFLKFQNQYHLKSWNNFPAMKCKKHPYFANNFGLDYGTSLKMMYDSITFAPLKWHWLEWTIISEAQNRYSFSAVNVFGIAVMKAFRRMIRIMANAKEDFPNWTLVVAPNNEEICSGPGDRSEINSWFHDAEEAQGLIHGQNNFYRNTNRQAEASDPKWATKMKTIHADFGRPWGVNFGLNCLHEVHVDGINDIDAILNLGYDKDRTIWSLDGAPENAQFIPESRAVAQRGYKYFDAKYWEGLGGVTPKPPFKWMYNWKQAFHSHAAIIS